MSQDPAIFSTILTASGHYFGRATLDAPASLNALSLEMVDLLAPQLDRWAADPDLAGVVLDAAGGKAFCAGGDVGALYRAIKDTEPGTVPAGAARFFEHEYRLDYRIHTYPKPVLCWGHGIVMGGGIGLLAGASHRVLTPKTRLAMPEITIGLYPDVGGSWFLGRAPGRLGLFLALTGAPLNASDACFAGLGDFVLHHEDHGRVLKGLEAGEWSGDASADGAPLSKVQAHLERINAVIGHDALIDIAPRLRELANDADPWLAAAGTAFIKGSPTSAHLAVEMQRRAKHLSLADAFRLEYQASVGCCMHSDFAEGVRALLIDKDKSPGWRPATLGEVSPAFVDEHIASPSHGPQALADLA